MAQKYYITILIVISLLGIGNHYFQEYKRDELINEMKDDLKEEKKLIEIKISKEKDSLNLKISNLIQSNEKAISDSQYWYSQAKKKNISPDYDFDFMSAANIISKSNYRSDKRDSIVGPGSNNK